MSDNRPYTTSNVVRGSIMLVLLCALFTLISSVAFAAMQSSQSHTVRSLANVPASGAGPAGTVDLRWDEQTRVLTATVSVSGLQAGSSYANHIHAGDCSVEGKLLYPLNDLVADATGSGTATTTINNITNGIPTSGWDVMVHNGPTAAANTLLCGNVVNTNGATEVSVPLSLMAPMP